MTHPQVEKKMGFIKLGFLFGYTKWSIIGGAVVAYRTNGINMLEGRDDIAVLWDIRINPLFKQMEI